MSYDILFQQALKLHNAGKLTEAEMIYRQILETAPDNPDVLNLLGLVAQSKNIDDEAAALFSRAIKTSPDFAPYYFNLGLSLLRLQKPAEAKEVLQKAVSLKPFFPEAYYQLGNAEKSLENRKNATEYYQKATEQDPDYIEALIELALASAEPEKQLLRLSEQYPASPLPDFYLSVYFREKGDSQKALTFAKQARTKAPKAPEPCLLEAELLAECGNRQAAKEAFERCLQLFPGLPDAIKGLADILTLEKEYKQAENYYKRALDSAPQRADILTNYADMLYRSGRLQEAVEIYHQAVILSPDTPEISNNLGIIQRDMGDLDEALGLFFNALRLNPERTEFSANIAETLTLLYAKAPEKAQKIADNWLKTYPQNHFARHLSAALCRNRSEDNTTDYSRELFNLFAPNYEQTLKNIAYSLPEQIKKIIGSPEGTIIDLGCGTGLVAAALKTEANTFIGVDLSSEMLKIATEKDLYDKLIEQDILSFLQTNTIRADLFIAADVFCYIGDLSPVLSRTFPVRICFSVEKSFTDVPFTLTPPGRYQHNPDHIKTLLIKSGYSKINQYAVTLRQEAGQDVEGVIFTAE